MTEAAETLAASFMSSARTVPSAHAHWRRSVEKKTPAAAMTRLLAELHAMGDADTVLDGDEISYIASVFGSAGRGHDETMAVVRLTIMAEAAPHIAWRGGMALKDFIAIVAHAGNAIAGAPASQAHKRDAVAVLERAGIPARESLASGLARLGVEIAGQKTPAADYHASTRH